MRKLLKANTWDRILLMYFELLTEEDIWWLSVDCHINPEIQII